VELDAHRLVWVTHEGEQGSALQLRARRRLWKRIKAQVISWLPIEWLL
jgi:hypothetical protein